MAGQYTTFPISDLAPRPPRGLRVRPAARGNQRTPAELARCDAELAERFRRAAPFLDGYDYCGGRVVFAGRPVAAALGGENGPQSEAYEAFLVGQLSDGEAAAAIQELGEQLLGRAGGVPLDARRSAWGVSFHRAGWPRVQVRARIYGSVGEALAEYDVGSLGVAFDGQRAYLSRAGRAAAETATNAVDPTRRRLGFELRLVREFAAGFGVGLGPAGGAEGRLVAGALALPYLVFRGCAEEAEGGPADGPWEEAEGGAGDGPWEEAEGWRPHIPGISPPDRELSAATAEPRGEAARVPSGPHALHDPHAPHPASGYPWGSPTAGAIVERNIGIATGAAGRGGARLLAAGPFRRGTSLGALAPEFGAAAIREAAGAALAAEKTADFVGRLTVLLGPVRAAALVAALLLDGGQAEGLGGQFEGGIAAGLRSLPDLNALCETRAAELRALRLEIPFQFERGPTAPDGCMFASEWYGAGAPDTP